jgi:hypothetical protein
VSSVNKLGITGIMRPMPIALMVKVMKMKISALDRFGRPGKELFLQYNLKETRKTSFRQECFWGLANKKGR